MQNDEYIDKSSNKVKVIWNIIKRERGEIKPIHTNIEIKLNNGSISNPEVVVNSFNKFFTSIAEKLVKSNPNKNYQPANQTCHICAESIFITKVTGNDVAKDLRQLKNSHSAGIDGFPAAVIKYSAGTFPEALKLSKVIPVFKKVDNKDMNNYRSISNSS
ncbi:uncharacterized protein LOC124776290 [Schistocerca piceifrons]|uniref:uncharacterized protein LOC124776290 n=1 Tax=Schistocerca piceifrons TaxID=274613 RepID=UPI001F5E8D6B|nr:uncharacterized protein LOC124776290 [Schistocerca piceifrons]